ncbi:hypothetical protein Tcan_13968 [Toxocara canis]|uniref:Tudor domain-containing protein n=1 Tax=Toxocara canis TaxID=6265 RepID=A0A0B2VC06_TOXCA|nr:hypothetical protein Tcan_13968 [Toxocara canis]
MEEIVIFNSSLAWTSLYVQLPPASLLLTQLQPTLSSYYNSSRERIVNPLPGMTAIAKIGENNECFRIMVIKRESPVIVKVFFVDYGNTEGIDIRVLHKMPHHLLEIPDEPPGYTDDVKQSMPYFPVGKDAYVPSDYKSEKSQLITGSLKKKKADEIRYFKPGDNNVILDAAKDEKSNDNFISYTRRVEMTSNSVLNADSVARISDSRSTYAAGAFVMQGPVFWMCMFVAVPVVVLLITAPVILLYKHRRGLQNKKKSFAFGTKQSEFGSLGEEEQDDSSMFGVQSMESLAEKKGISEEDLASFAGLIVAEKLRPQKRESKRRRHRRTSRSRSSSRQENISLNRGHRNRRTSHRSMTHSDRTSSHDRISAGLSPKFIHSMNAEYHHHMDCKDPLQTKTISLQTTNPIQDVKICDDKTMHTSSSDRSVTSHCASRSGLTSCSHFSVDAIRRAQLSANETVHTSDDDNSLVSSFTSYSGSNSSSSSTSTSTITEVELNLKERHAKRMCSVQQHNFEISERRTAEDSAVPKIANGSRPKAEIVQETDSEEKMLGLKKSIPTSTENDCLMKRTYIALQLDHSEEEESLNESETKYYSENDATTNNRVKIGHTYKESSPSRGITCANSVHDSDLEMPQLSAIDRAIRGDGMTVATKPEAILINECGKLRSTQTPKCSARFVSVPVEVSFDVSTTTNESRQQCSKGFTAQRIEHAKLNITADSSDTIRTMCASTNSSEVTSTEASLPKTESIQQMLACKERSKLPTKTSMLSTYSKSASDTTMTSDSRFSSTTSS